MSEEQQSGVQAIVCAETVRERFRKLDRRQWWLWSTAVLVLILLSVGVASFAFPNILSQEHATYSFYLDQSVRSVVGLVLIFCLYLAYQQSQIIRVRNQLADQVEVLAKVQARAHEVYNLAALDQLTGLYNRRSGEQRLAEEITRAARHQRPLTVLSLDLDGLKETNDKMGHAAGDLVIKTFAERLQRSIRGSDVAMRLGGDEFVALLPECRMEEVKHVIGRIEGLEVEYGGVRVPVRCSRGWTDYKPGETSGELLKRADEALYADKRASKQNRLSQAQPAL